MKNFTSLFGKKDNNDYDKFYDREDDVYENDDDDVTPYSNKAAEALLEENNVANDEELDEGFLIEETEDALDDLGLGDLFGDAFAEDNDDNI